MVGTPSAGSALTMPDPAALLDHLPMFLAHTVVAVLVGVWLAAGERALWALLTLVFSAVVALFVVPPAVPLIAAPPGSGPASAGHPAVPRTRRRASSYAAVHRLSSPPDLIPRERGR